MGVQSIRQSVQNGQFLSSPAQSVSHLLIASQADEGVERLFAQVIVAALAIDQTPTVQPSEPAYDGSTRHAHIGSNLGDRKWSAVDIAKCYA